uniref:(northern house mosquito) hypothetical protein n=1 Tax=Culex pipiens TaxID=7175 RepID=A0A8D8G435_CULPI
MAQLDISHLSRAVGKSGQNHGRLSPEAAGAALRLRRDCTSGADAGGPAGRNRWPHRRQPQSVPVQNRLVGSHVHVELFLQSPANPDLLYIIFFCHTQLTVTLLLGLIFGSKVYLVFRGGGKHQDDSTGLGIKPSGAKFISRTHNRGFANASSVTTSTAQLGGNIVNEGRLTEEEATEEIKQLYNQLQRLYDRIPQRGTAIATLAALMETCKNVSLKPPPTVVPKAIMPAPQENGLIRVDKSTNTNSIPNGKFESNTRITITDDSDHHLNNNNNNHRSIDNSSNFNLDSLQLKCMCSEEEVLDGEPKCECHKGGAAEVPSCTNTVRSSCKSSVCCDSGRREQEQEEPGGERSKSLLVKRNSELMLNSSSNSSCCRDGSGRNGSARHPASGGASCSTKTKTETNFLW